MNQTPDNIYRLLLHFVNAYPLKSFIVVGALLAAGLIETMGLSALLPLLNTILENNNPGTGLLSTITTQFFALIGMEKTLPNLLIVIVLAITLKAVITLQALKIVAFSAADITHDFRVGLIDAMMKAKWQYFATLPTGKSSNAIATEAESAGHFYTLAGKTLVNTIQALVYLGIAFLVDWKISIAAMVLGGCTVFIFKYFVKITRQAAKEFTHSLNMLLNGVSESIAGAKTLKAMGEEDKFSLLLKNDITAIKNARKKLAASNLTLSALQEPILVFVIAVGLYVIFTYTGYAFGEVMIITFLFYRLMGYANQVQTGVQQTIGFEAPVKSILTQTQNALNNREIMSGSKPPVLNIGITLKNLFLGYDQIAILENINDFIPAHKITAIYGPSGSGKSTLLDSLLGLQTPLSGGIYLDNDNLRDVNIKKWRTSIGYVPQETFLFHDSVLRNITLDDNNYDQNMVIETLKKVNAWEFVHQTQEGLLHIVGERGGKLSGGQRQRLALARAIVRNPKLLILDEATSGLDKESEDSIFKSLRAMLADTTIITISHDPKILQFADHIIHLNNNNTNHAYVSQQP